MWEFAQGGFGAMTYQDLAQGPLLTSRIGSFPAKSQSIIKFSGDTIRAASPAWRLTISQLFLLDIACRLAVIGFLVKRYLILLEITGTQRLGFHECDAVD
jgi:hypothetical protein